MNAPIVPAIALHAGDHIQVRVPRPAALRRMVARIRRRRPVTVFEAVVRVVEIGQAGGLADVEACDMPGLFVTIPFGTDDTVSLISACGAVA